MDDHTEAGEGESSVEDSFHSATEMIDDGDLPSGKAAVQRKKDLTPEEAEGEEQKAVRAIV
ncbi:hypothetical protein LTS01_026192, partial [Friedmanniomyces endolithicus]